MTVSAFEVPLTPQAQRLSVSLAGTTYALSVVWNQIADSWTLDIADDSGVPLAQGIALVAGTDLIGQLVHLGLSGGLIVYTDGDAEKLPSYADLGVSSHLVFVQRGVTP